MHTYILIYIQQYIWGRSCFFRIMTAQVSSVLMLCQIKNTLYKRNVIQTRRLPLNIKYAVHLPATKQNTTVSSGQWHANSSNYNRNQGLQKTHGHSNSVTQHMPQNLNDRVAVKRTVGLLRKQQYSTMVNSMTMNTKVGWPHRTNYYLSPPP